jgi:hypothetical protein
VLENVEDELEREDPAEGERRGEGWEGSSLVGKSIRIGAVLLHRLHGELAESSEDEEGVLVEDGGEDVTNRRHS